MPLFVDVVRPSSVVRCPSAKRKCGCGPALCCSADIIALRHMPTPTVHPCCFLALFAVCTCTITVRPIDNVAWSLGETATVTPAGDVTLVPRDQRP